jgi:hypothetical protein
MKYLPVLWLSCSLVCIAGCSMHPLQDDVTGLPLERIVEKVRCEASDAVKRILVVQGLEPEKASFLVKDQALKQQIKKASKLREEAARLDTMQQDLLKRKAELLSVQQAMLQITTAKEIAEENRNNIAEETARNPYLPGRQIKPAQLPNDYEEIKNRFIAQRELYKSDVLKYQERVVRNKLALAPISTEIARINGEISSNVGWKNIRKFYNHEMASDFRFKITETNNAGVTAAYRLPLPLGTLTVGLDGSDTKERESERNAKLTISFRELDEMSCVNGVPETAHALRYPIRGNIGLFEVLDQYVKLSNQKDGKLAKASPYSDQITFTTTLDGGVSSDVVIAPTPREQLTASLDLGGTRKDLHSVTISLAQPAPTESGDKITRVRLVSEDQLDIDQ